MTLGSVTLGQATVDPFCLSPFCLKVPNTIIDLSGGLPNGGRMSNWAIRDQEVLIRNSIPADAITRVK